jgi:putative sterol carrier protein
MKSRSLIFLLFGMVAVQPLHSVAAKTPGYDALPQQVFDGMRQSFVANRAKAVHVRYQFDLSGPNGGLWWIEVNNGKCKFGRGRIPNPDTTFISSDRDWVALSNGKLSGVWAYMTGRLKIRGDQRLARKLDDLFNR